MTIPTTLADNLRYIAGGFENGAERAEGSNQAALIGSSDPSALMVTDIRISVAGARNRAEALREAAERLDGVQR